MRKKPMVSKNPYINNTQGVLGSTDLRAMRNASQRGSLSGFSQEQIQMPLQQASIGTPVQPNYNPTPVNKPRPSVNVNTGSAKTNGTMVAPEGRNSFDPTATPSASYTFGETVAGVKTMTEDEMLIANTVPVVGTFMAAGMAAQRAKQQGLTAKNVKSGNVGSNVMKTSIENLSGKGIRQDRNVGTGVSASDTYSQMQREAADRNGTADISDRAGDGPHGKGR